MDMDSSQAGVINTSEKSVCVCFYRVSETLMHVMDVSYLVSSLIEEARSVPNVLFGAGSSQWLGPFSSCSLGPCAITTNCIACVIS